MKCLIVGRNKLGLKCAKLRSAFQFSKLVLGSANFEVISILLEPVEPIETCELHGQLKLLHINIADRNGECSSRYHIGDANEKKNR